MIKHKILKNNTILKKNKKVFLFYYKKILFFINLNKFLQININFYKFK